MQLRSLLRVGLALLLAGGTSALAQGSGSWIDPPAEITPPVVSETPAAPPPARVVPSPSGSASPRTPAKPLAQPAEPPRASTPQVAPPAEKPRRTAAPSAKTAPVPPPEVIEGGAPEHRGPAARVAAAEALATDYLSTWSGPNALTLDSTTGFYASRVRFHGRVMSPRELLAEKRRFVQRWPERSYRPRPATMGTACASQGNTCTVRSVFDFSAANPAAGRRSQGIGTLELVVSFAGERPVIMAESSVVLGRSRGEQRSALEEKRQ